MNLDHVREFLFLSRTLSYTVTAKHFFISQSVLSKHISSMEHELKAKLFERRGHSVALTKEGEAFLEDARKMIACFNRGMARVSAASSSYKAMMRIGYLRHADRPFLVDFVKCMRRSHPEIGLKVELMDYGELRRAIKMQTIDFAFGLDVDAELLEQCESFPIAEDRFDVVVSYSHPLASKALQGVDVADLSGYTVMLPDPTEFPGLSTFIEGFLPRGCLKSGKHHTDVDMLFLGVELGDGVAFSVEGNLPLYGNRMCFIRVNDKETKIGMTLFWLRGTQKCLVEACVEAIEHCGSSDGGWARNREELQPMRETLLSLHVPNATA